MNSPCFEQTKTISRGHCSPKETREATEAPSSQVISLNKLSSKSDKPREATAAQKKTEQATAASIITHTYSLHTMKEN